MELGKGFLLYTPLHPSLMHTHAHNCTRTKAPIQRSINSGSPVNDPTFFVFFSIGRGTIPLHNTIFFFFFYSTDITGA